MFPQGTELRPRQEFTFQVKDKGRKIKFKITDVLLVGNSSANQKLSKNVEICRPKQKMGTGYLFTLNEAAQFFTRKCDTND